MVWDGKTWTEAKSAGSCVVSHAYGIATDDRNSSVVLFGGAGASVANSASTWIWTGSSWSAAKTSISPQAMSDPAMFWHEDMRRVVLQGGQVQAEFSETWSWDGKSWESLPGPALDVRHAHQIVWDDTRCVALGFGGLAKWTAQDSTYEFRGPWLSTNRTSLPRSGGTMEIQLTAGDREGGDLYLLLGSNTGTSPGIDLGGPHMLLRPYPDWYFDYLVQYTNFLIVGSLGRMDFTGRSTATMKLQALPPGFPKIRLWHAFVLFDQPLPGPLFGGTSNVVPLDLN